MPHHVLRNTLAGALISAAAASSAMAQDITVTGQRERVVDRTSFNADVVEYTASVIVNLRDLDLASAAGRQAMNQRLLTASRAACDDIEQRIPIDLRPDRSDCARSAYRDAVARVRESARPPSD